MINTFSEYLEFSFLFEITYDLFVFFNDWFDNILFFFDSNSNCVWIKFNLFFKFWIFLSQFLWTDLILDNSSISSVNVFIFIFKSFKSLFLFSSNPLLTSYNKFSNCLLSFFSAKANFLVFLISSSATHISLLRVCSFEIFAIFFFKIFSLINFK